LKKPGVEDYLGGTRVGGLQDGKGRCDWRIMGINKNFGSRGKKSEGLARAEPKDLKMEFGGDLGFKRWSRRVGRLRRDRGRQGGSNFVGLALGPVTWDETKGPW